MGNLAAVVGDSVQLMLPPPLDAAGSGRPTSSSPSHSESEQQQRATAAASFKISLPIPMPMQLPMCETTSRASERQTTNESESECRRSATSTSSSPPLLPVRFRLAEFDRLSGSARTRALQRLCRPLSVRLVDLVVELEQAGILPPRQRAQAAAPEPTPAPKSTGGQASRSSADAKSSICTGTPAAPAGRDGCAPRVSASGRKRPSAGEEQSSSPQEAMHALAAPEKPRAALLDQLGLYRIPKRPRALADEPTPSLAKPVARRELPKVESATISAARPQCPPPAPRPPPPPPPPLEQRIPTWTSCAAQRSPELSFRRTSAPSSAHGDKNLIELTPGAGATDLRSCEAALQLESGRWSHTSPPLLVLQPVPPALTLPLANSLFTRPPAVHSPASSPHTFGLCDSQLWIISH